MAFWASYISFYVAFPFSYICVELDVLAIVHLLKNSNANYSLESLLTDCKDLLKSFPNLQIKHAYREANWCADVLARLGNASSEAIILFS